MNPDDLWKLLLGGLVTLIGGLLLHQVQLGGRRRRRRRDIREQLELLRMLDDHPAVAARMRRRVEVALDQYEPPLEKRRARWDRWGASISNLIAISLLIPVLVLRDTWFDSVWQIAGIAVVAGTLAVAIEELVSRRLQLREQDDAVDAVTEEGAPRAK